MTMATNEPSPRFDRLQCCGCYRRFEVESDWNRSRENYRDSVTCPYCTTKLIPTEWEVDRLKRVCDSLESENARLRQENEQADRRAVESLRRLSAIRGVNTRLRRRIANGGCPCCQRTFGDLAAHMATKHEGYSDGGR